MPKIIPGYQRDADYLLSKGADLMQVLAWIARHPSGNSYHVEMDRYLQGGHK